MNTYTPPRSSLDQIVSLMEGSDVIVGSHLASVIWGLYGMTQGLKGVPQDVLLKVDAAMQRFLSSPMTAEEKVTVIRMIQYCPPEYVSAPVRDFFGPVCFVRARIAGGQILGDNDAEE